ncbi:MAG TPA: glycoside hydrolase family 27 protein [Opitutaceae bacterium]
MKYLRLLLPATIALSGLAAAHAQKFEGLAQTPPMGWNTWNTFAGDINEALVKDTAEAMIKNGMRDAGYVYVVLDDTWSTKERDANGNLVADPAKFPSGMKALGDFLHERGFKFGIYNCAGAQTCAGYPGSLGHEYQDARSYASWGVDYLKYDWCNTGTRDAREAYSTMRDALRAAGRPVVLSMCEWGTAKPWEWAADVGHLWRTTGDIYDSYDGKKGWEIGWKNILDAQVELAKYAGPGHWNDPDMLEVGNAGLTFAESRAHFSFWCILAAPLMAGNDVRNMTPEIRAVLTDKEAIAINQDSLGKQGFRALAAPSQKIEVWARELSSKEWAICVLNTGDAKTDLTVEWNRFHFLHGTYSIREIWSKQAIGDTSKPYTRAVDSHDVVFFRLTPQP